MPWQSHRSGIGQNFNGGTCDEINSKAPVIFLDIHILLFFPLAELSFSWHLWRWPTNDGISCNMVPTLGPVFRF